MKGCDESMRKNRWGEYQKKILKKEEGEGDMKYVYTFYRKGKEASGLVQEERCFYLEAIDLLLFDELLIIRWLIEETFEPKGFSDVPFIASAGFLDPVVEIGPRLNFATAWNTNALSILRACGITKVTRFEYSRRFRIPNSQDAEKFIHQHCDRMTQMVYPEPLKTFETGIQPKPVFFVPVLSEGPEALRRINTEMGLGMDEWDINYYYKLFYDDIGRNPTNVECFQLGQANSEHSRHWFFKGKMVIDGKKHSYSLLDLVKLPLKFTLSNRGKSENSIIAFSDNSSGIRGYRIQTIIPKNPGKCSRFNKKKLTYHIIFTAETHNFPSGVAPFPGAETGTGGRERDVQATGQGALVIAGTAAYCVGNLQIPGYKLPWEDDSFIYPENLATPLQIEIQSSNGASDYGNKFGEPVIQGFTRSFGLRLPDGERREWIKPIMFTGGVGQIDARHIKKDEPKKGMLIVQIGGPAYRIGMGGGSASSMIQGQNVAKLDDNAVQRGDAEMEQKMNRIIRACVEMGDKNPIVAIHDQGAGGPCNVVTELVNPAGGFVNIRKIKVGDETLSVVEIWGAEYQERNALLIWEDRIAEFYAISRREKIEPEILGEITNDGFIRVLDNRNELIPVNLELSKILGDMPQKTFTDNHIAPVLEPFVIPKELTVRDALNRVLRLVSVGSKRFLTNKVDRSVTGLIVQQQCVGPLQLPLSNVAVIGQSHFGLTGAATSIGEKPILGLIDPKAMARMAVAEALTNIMWARVSDFSDIKFSANWMWAAKLPGEAAKMYEAAKALSEILIDLGLAIDGGKDSLSMAAKVILPDGSTELVKSPGQLVLSGYCTVSNITKVITPDIKRPGESKLIFINLADGKRRLGGSALAQVYGQIGDECPDIEDPELLKRVFLAIQELIEKDLILAGHDISDGGLIVTLLEMAFAGNCGILSNMVMQEKDIFPTYFSEEAGLLIECAIDDEDSVYSLLEEYKIYHQTVGFTTREKEIHLQIDTHLSEDATRLMVVLREDMRVLRGIWEETSYQLERLQCDPQCAEEEKKKIFDRSGMKFNAKFVSGPTPELIMNLANKPKVAIIREEGSNGDREMTSAFYSAGFEVWDVTMTDLLNDQITLDKFRGIAFVGGFSYADVLDSAKGWAAVIRFNPKLRKMFDEFYARPDTFSFGVCNGCQLMALLGWVPWRQIPDEIQPRFVKNKSGRFESRFSAAHILKSPAIMLKGMEGSTLGVWVAHGEGRMHFPDESILKEVFEKFLAPIRFVDDNCSIAEGYPFNPNGSPHGIAALCSPDGRHFAIMPHPERTFLKWQWPYGPEEWKNDSDQTSPWLKMFQNAREWCGK